MTLNDGNQFLLLQSVATETIVCEICILNAGFPLYLSTAPSICLALMYKSDHTGCRESGIIYSIRGQNLNSTYSD